MPLWGIRAKVVNLSGKQQIYYPSIGNIGLISVTLFQNQISQKSFTQKNTL
jgi:hypothetical protein